MKKYQKNLIKFYTFSILFFSLLPLIFRIPSSLFFQNKQNYLNKYFVKFGWFWTCAALILMMVKGKKTQFKNSLISLILATVYFQLVSRLIYNFYYYIGSCQDSKFMNYSDCRNNDFKWQGFDISGHVFLLLHSSLVLVEEMKNLHVKGSFWFLAAISLISLWYLMLAITCLYFHPMSEIVVGLWFGIAGWLLIYIAPKVLLL